MPRLNRTRMSRQNRRARQGNNPTQAEAHTEADAPAEPDVPNEAVAEDTAEEQNDDVEDAVNTIETGEAAEGAEGADVTETPRRRRKRKSRPNQGRPTADNNQNENTGSRMAGMIFMCSTATKKDCFKYGVFGFPDQKKDTVAQVKKGMKLFLYDVDKKHLHGIYEASSRGGMNLVPEAFQGTDRKFPAQVKFRIHKDCMPVAGRDFKQAIKDSSNSGGRFNVDLTAEQVRKLVPLFRPLSQEGLQQPTQPGRGRDTQREPASRDAHRGPSRDRHARRGPPQDRYFARPPPPVPVREPIYSRESASLYARERLPIELDYYLAQPSYLSSSQLAATEAEAARRRYLDTLYLQEASLAAQRPLQEASLIAQRPLPYDPLYRGAEYQREVPYYSNYGVSRI